MGDNNNVGLESSQYLFLSIIIFHRISNNFHLHSNQDARFRDKTTQCWEYLVNVLTYALNIQDFQMNTWENTL